MVNKRETGFSRTTIVNNRNQGDGANYHAFNDPFLIYIDDSEDQIYFGGRTINEGIRSFIVSESYATPFQTSAEMPLFVQGNWLSYYGKRIAFGARHIGFQKDTLVKLL